MRLRDRLLACLLSSLLSASGLLVLHGAGQTQQLVQPADAAHPVLLSSRHVLRRAPARPVVAPRPALHPGNRVVKAPRRLPQHAAPALVIQPNPEGWIDHRPSVTQEQVAHALSDAGSPLAGLWPREDKYDYAEYIYHAGAALGIDPAVFLGFFRHESSYGLAGMATITHSPGNLRCYNSTLPGSYCDNVSGGYEAYRTWFDGIDAMYALLWHYVHDLHLRRVDDVVPVWAPPGDSNDDYAYIHGVLDTMGQITTL